MHLLGQADPVTQAATVEILDSSTDGSECLNTGSQSIQTEHGQIPGNLATGTTSSDACSLQGLGEQVVGSQLGISNLRVELGADMVPSQQGSLGLGTTCQGSGTISSGTISDSTVPLDPYARPFVASSRILGGLVTIDTHADLEHVRQVQAGK